MQRIIKLILISMLVMGGIGSAYAQSATNQTWTSSITYYTPSDVSGTLIISFYPEGSGTPITLDPISLSPHKAGSLFVGGVSSLGTFTKGAAVLNADVPIVATYVQFAAPPETGNYARLLYSGFTSGGSTIYIPTFLNGAFGSTSLMGIQNLEGFVSTIEVRFYQVGSTTPARTVTYDVPPFSSVILPANDQAKVGLPSGFNGSAVVRAYRQGDPNTPAQIIASVQETDDYGRGAYAFEGVAQGATTIYMATMLCNAFGTNQTSYYAIQNISLTETATVTVRFYDTSGQQIGQTPSQTLLPANKWSLNPCTYVTPGTSGSAVITSTIPVVAIGKVKDNTGMSTAFVGQAQGGLKIVAPYIRWSANPTQEWRTYVAIMNVGNGNATNIQVKYYDGNGTLKATHQVATASNPLPPFIKRNTNPQAAGALDDTGNFGFTPPGGAIEITSDQPIVVVVRAQRDLSPPLGSVSRFAEDYNGVNVP
ncbi:MAG: hypothetical protein QXH51_07875 [Candidatus Bathyarchaeia archaeon]